MDNSINNLFINSICNTCELKTVFVKFYGRRDLIEYPEDLIDLLKTDKHVQDIIDPDTYEVIYSNDL